MSLPDKDPTVDSRSGFPTRSWLRWFSDADKTIDAVRRSGPTAGRPTKDLFIGQVYFDTTLGYPVWLQSVGPVVWVDSTGAPA
jgi:hypothetical protein